MLGGDQAGTVVHDQAGQHRQASLVAELLLSRMGDLVGGETLELLFIGIGGDQTQAHGGGNGQSE